MTLTDDELIRELSTRFANSRKAFSDLSTLNAKLLEMNRRLEQSEALKSNFLSNIRCEINNPLNVIIGLASQLADRSRRGEADTRDVASQIYAEAAHLDFQLRNIIVAAELEAGDAGIFAARVDVSALVASLCESYRLFAAHKQVTVHVSDGAPLFFVTDAEKLLVMVANLLANAVEFSHPGGGVDVRVGRGADDCLWVEVEDHGIGIAPEDQKRVFDRFFQLEGGSRRSHPGHGLGLSITKAMVELLQGSIELTSVPGTGTRVTLVVPELGMETAEGAFSPASNFFMFEEMDKV